MFGFFGKNFPVGVDISDASIEILRLNGRKEILSHGRIVLESGSENIPKIEETTSTLKIVIQDTPTGWLNVRQGPGLNYDVILKVYPNDIYILLEKKDDWYKIKIDEEKEGWINSQYASKK